MTEERAPGLPGSAEDGGRPPQPQTAAARRLPRLWFLNLITRESALKKKEKKRKTDKNLFKKCYKELSLKSFLG